MAPSPGTPSSRGRSAPRKRWCERISFIRSATRRLSASRRSSPRTATRSGSRFTAIAGVRRAALPTRHISGMPITTSDSPCARCRKAAKQAMRTSAQVVDVCSPTARRRATVSASTTTDAATVRSGAPDAVRAAPVGSGSGVSRSRQ